MVVMQWVIEIGLMGLLIVTLVHLLRLGRALALLKRDREPLEDLVADFAASTREAQQGIEHLRQTADGAGRRIAQQIETATALRDDLAYMIERAERLADRLDGSVRHSRAFEPAARSAAMAVSGYVPTGFVSSSPRDNFDQNDQVAPSPKVRSQAERDLLQALRLNK